MASNARKMFANLNSRNGRSDRFEFTPNFHRGVHLQVEHILVRRPARKKNHDDCFVRLLDAGGRFGFEKLWNGQTTEAQTADFEEISPRNAVAELGPAAIDR